MAEANHYEKILKIGIVCIDNDELKLFDHGSVFKQFLYFLTGQCLQPFENQSHIFNVSGITSILQICHT